MYRVLNAIPEYIYFYKSKNITSYTFLLVFQIVERLKCILKNLVSRVDLMYQPSKCPYSYFSKALQFYLRVLFFPLSIHKNI